MSQIPGVGDALPDIAIQTTDGGSVKPSDFAGKKLVVFFYPKDSTPGCTTENQDFSALKPEFDKAGVALLGVSKDPPKKHLGFIAKYDLTAPLASDAEEGGLSDALGIWTEKAELWPHLHGHGAHHLSGGQRRQDRPRLEQGEGQGPRRRSA